MDYTLAALKVFGSHLADSTNAPSSEGTSSAHMLFGVRYQRVWIQGVILSAEYQHGGEGRLVLDDGSCVAALFVSAKEAESRFWRAGMYVMVIGAYVAAEMKGNCPAIKEIPRRLVGPQATTIQPQPSFRTWIRPQPLDSHAAAVAVHGSASSPDPHTAAVQWIGILHAQPSRKNAPLSWLPPLPPVEDLMLSVLHPLSHRSRARSTVARACGDFFAPTAGLMGEDKYLETVWDDCSLWLMKCAAVVSRA